MTSDFVRNIHIRTARQMLDRGADTEQLAGHLIRVGFSEWEVAQLLNELMHLPGHSDHQRLTDAEF
jgi:putative AlgH/UPF0301 family transcriptional regulator